MKLNKMDLSTSVLSGLACLFLLIDLPVWGLFFGWAWYGPLGGTPVAFKKAIPPMLLGYAMGGISIIAYALSGLNIWALVIAVFATVFVIMIAAKTKPFAALLPAFNSFSCMFAAYYTGSFPLQETSFFADLNNVAICIGWLVLANVIGLCFGFMSSIFAPKLKGKGESEEA